MLSNTCTSLACLTPGCNFKRCLFVYCSVEYQIFSLFRHPLITAQWCLLCLSLSDAARWWWWWRRSAWTPHVYLSCVITHRLPQSREWCRGVGVGFVRLFDTNGSWQAPQACGEKGALGREPWATSAFARFPPQTSTLKTSFLLALLAAESSGQLKGRFKEDSEEKT